MIQPLRIVALRGEVACRQITYQSRQAIDVVKSSASHQRHTSLCASACTAFVRS